jgi:PAS domain S-box-containing protein
MDLNIEESRIERPLKPMIRFGTPVFNDQEEKIGVVILNYFAKDLINTFKRQPADNQSQFMLLNSEGYWLYHPDTIKRWGFMIEDRKNQVLKNEFPEIWDKISAQEKGQSKTDQGLFTFITIYPRGKEQQDYYWKLVTHRSPSLFENERNILTTDRLVLLVLMIVVLLIINIPITYILVERKIAKNRLKENQNYYKSLFKENKMINLLINPATANIKDANRAALDFYGYSKEKITNMKITDINILAEEEVTTEMKRAKSENRNYFEFTHQLADGSLCQVEVYSKPILIDDQELLYSFIYDVSQREALKEKVALQEEKYKTLFETTGTATFILDEENIISLVNRQAEFLTGYSKQEMEGEINFVDLIAYMSDRNKMVAWHKKRGRTDQDIPNRYEFSLKDKQGQIKEVLINVRMIGDSRKSIISLIDITEKKKQRRLLNQAYDKLSENLDKTKKLHQRFLPTEFPSLNSLSFAAHYQAAEKIGGDFYNYIQLGNKFIFYLVDITGHGLEGAMLNIFIRETINNYIIQVKEENLSLNTNEIMEYVFEKYNQEEFPDDYFVSLMIGVLDINTYQIELSNMGIHILPCLFGLSPQLISLPVSGLPITDNLDDDLYLSSNIIKKTFKLEAGSTLFLTTDGLIEEINQAGTRYGEKRLKEQLKKDRFFEPEIIKERIKSSFRNFKTNVNQQDDITFLIVHRDLEELASFSKVIPSDLESIYQVHEQIKKFIQDYSKSVDEIMIGLQEVLLNAVEHGNQLDSLVKIEIEIKVKKEYLEIIITDEGTGFNWEERLNGVKSLEDSYNLKKLEERGRGLLIAQEALDKIVFNQLGNKAYLYKLF